MRRWDAIIALVFVLPDQSHFKSVPDRSADGVVLTTAAGRIYESVN